MPEWNYFISHASEDKLLIAAPLAHVLQDGHFTVWYDDFSLHVGDSLSATISRGLQRSDYGIVILSPHFFARPWPRRELAALSARDGDLLRPFLRRRRRGSSILPVWHDVTAHDIERHAPNLVDIRAISTSKGLQAVAEQIVRATYPDRLGDLPLTNVMNDRDHQQIQNDFRALLDSKPPLHDVRLFLSAYHSLLHSMVGFHPQLIPAYKLDCPVPFDFALLVAQGMTGPMLLELITLGPVESTAGLSQLLKEIEVSLGPRQAIAERSANAYAERVYAGEYTPLVAAMRRLHLLLSTAGRSIPEEQLSTENIHWDKPEEWQISLRVIAGRRRRRREGIEEEREAVLKSVHLPVELASYDRLLD